MAGGVRDRRRDLDEQIEERPEVLPGLGKRSRRGPGLGVRVDDRELDLVLVGAEVHEQLVHLVEHFGRTGVTAVDLVQGDDDRQPPGHRLLEDVPRLGQRALGGVHEQQHRVDHQERSLDLAAEVGVPGRVDDVEPDAGVVDGRLLGEDRDPLLALEVARVEHPVDERLVRPEGTGLPEHRVHERGLAVVDVGDDGDVAQVRADRGGCAGGGVGHGRTDLQVVGTADCATEPAIPVPRGGGYTPRDDRRGRDPVRHHRRRVEPTRSASHASDGWLTWPGPAAPCP